MRLELGTLLLLTLYLSNVDSLCFRKRKCSKLDKCARMDKCESEVVFEEPVTLKNPKKECKSTKRISAWERVPVPPVVAGIAGLLLRRRGPGKGSCRGKLRHEPLLIEMEVPREGGSTCHACPGTELLLQEESSHDCLQAPVYYPEVPVHHPQVPVYCPEVPVPFNHVEPVEFSACHELEPVYPQPVSHTVVRQKLYRPGYKGRKFLRPFWDELSFPSRNY